MGKLIYSMSTSLDGYVADKNGNFDWGTPNEEEHLFINSQLRNVGTFLFGRKVCETMAAWDTMELDNKSVQGFAEIWNAADKVMYSRSLTKAFTQNTRVEHAFDADAVRKLVRSSDKDVNIGGPHLAAEAIRAGLVDDYHQYVVPIIIGDGNRWMPMDVHIELELVDMRKFANGVVHLQYKPK